MFEPTGWVLWVTNFGAFSIGLLILLGIVLATFGLIKELVIDRYKEENKLNREMWKKHWAIVEQEKRQQQARDSKELS